VRLCPYFHLYAAIQAAGRRHAGQLPGAVPYLIIRRPGKAGGEVGRPDSSRWSSEALAAANAVAAAFIAGATAVSAGTAADTAATTAFIAGPSAVVAVTTAFSAATTALNAGVTAIAAGGPAAIAAVRGRLPPVGAFILHQFSESDARQGAERRKRSALKGFYFHRSS
jgi:hypothetical protein